MFRFAMSALAFCLILSCAVNAASLKEELEERALIKRLDTMLDLKDAAAPPPCNLNQLDQKYWYCYGSTCSYEVLDSTRYISVIFKDNENVLYIKLRNMSFRLLDSVTKKDPEFPVSLDFTVDDVDYTVQVNSVVPMGDGWKINPCVNLS